MDTQNFLAARSGYLLEVTIWTG